MVSRDSAVSPLSSRKSLLPHDDTSAAGRQHRHHDDDIRAVRGEPTTGLDPYSRIQVWQAVRWLVSRGTTVLLTTQYLDEADRLSDRIAAIDHGKVVAEGTPGSSSPRWVAACCASSWRIA